MSETKEYSGNVIITSWFLLVPSLVLIFGEQYNIESLSLLAEIALYIISPLYILAWLAIGFLFCVWPYVKESAKLQNNNETLEGLESVSSKISLRVFEIVRIIISCFIIYTAMSPTLAIILSSILAFGHGVMIYRFPDINISFKI